MKAKQQSVTDLLAVNHSPTIDGILVIDSKGGIMAFNSAATHLLGFEESEVLGKSLNILMSHTQTNTYDEFLRKISDVTHKRTQTLNLSQAIIGKHKNGDLLPLELTISTDHSTANLRFTAVIQDLRKHEDTLTRLYQCFQSATDSLNQRIEFESILNNYGNLLLSCPANDFHHTMENALQAIGQFLSLDHCYILQLSGDFTKGALWAEWRRSASLMTAFPAYFDIPDSTTFLQALGNHDTIIIEQGGNKNDDVLFHLAQKLSPNGFLSTHITPILDDRNKPMGIIGFSILDPNHERPEAQFNLLNLATPLIINAWERHQLTIEARNAERSIQEKNKLLAEKATYSQALLNASNSLYSSSHEDIYKRSKAVLTNASLISGHQQAFMYFTPGNDHQLRSFIQQFFKTNFKKYPHITLWIEKLLTQQEIIQINNCQTLALENHIQSELTKNNIKSLSAIALKKGRNIIGGIIFYNALSTLKSDDETLRFLQLTAQNLIMAVQHHTTQFDLELSEHNLSNANRMLAQQALHDALTGLHNRRAFDNGITQEFDRAKRHDNNLTLLICDIDYFKFYNDHFGHTKGDTCLQQVAKTLQRTFNRAGEICTRYGGEEFAIILPSIGHLEAELQAQRLLNNLDACKIDHAPECPFEFVSLSIGIAQLTPEHTYDTIIDMIDDADKALYQAKNNGRNQLAWALKAE